MTRRWGYASFLYAKIVQSSVAIRLLGGVAANFYDRAVVMLVQFATIPVLTSQWGVSEYGIWLMLMTIPTYISLSDFGLGTAASVRITTEIARNRIDEALEVLQTAWLIVFFLAVPIAAVGIICAAYLYGHPNSIEGSISAKSLSLTIVFIVFYGILVMQMTVLTAVYRATHKFALGMYFSGTAYFIEGCALITVALLGQDIVVAAATILSVRAVSISLFALLLKRHEPWVKFGFGHATRRTLKSLSGPSLSAFSLTLSSAFVLQGVLLTLGWFVGPASVAAFSITRTITRAPLQISSAVLRPSIPELTRAQAKGDLVLLRQIVRTNMIVALLSTVPFVIGFSLFGQKLLLFITNGNIAVPWALFALLSCAASANAIWMAAASPLVAGNRQGMFAFWYLSLCACVLVVPVFISDSAIINVAVATMLAEIITGGFVVRALKSANYGVSS